MDRALILICLWSSISVAQSSDIPNCAKGPVPVDSIDRLVSIRVRLIDPTVKIPYGFMDSMGREIAKHVRISVDPSFRVLTGAAFRKDSLGKADSANALKMTLSLNGAVYFSLSKTGEISKIVTANPSGSAELPASLMRALQSTFYGSGNGISLPSSLKQKVVAFKLSVNVMLDSAHATKRSMGTRWVPVHWVKLPVYTIASGVIPRSTVAIKPDYPVTALWSGTEGLITVSFSVDQRGKVIPGSVDVLEGKYADFLKSVLEEIPKMRFEPAALSNGCPVGMQVQQPFAFTINK